MNMNDMNFDNDVSSCKPSRPDYQKKSFGVGIAIAGLLLAIAGMLAFKLYSDRKAAYALSGATPLGICPAASAHACARP